MTVLRQRVHASERVAHAALVLVALLLLAFLAAPLSTLLIKAVQDDADRFVGVANFVSYAQTPALLQSVWNSVWVSVVVMLFTVPTAFGFAYALTHRGGRTRRCGHAHENTRMRSGSRRNGRRLPTSSCASAR